MQLRRDCRNSCWSLLSAVGRKPSFVNTNTLANELYSHYQFLTLIRINYLLLRSPATMSAFPKRLRCRQMLLLLLADICTAQISPRLSPKATTIALRVPSPSPTKTVTVLPKVPSPSPKVVVPSPKRPSPSPKPPSPKVPSPSPLPKPSPIPKPSPSPRFSTCDARHRRLVAP